MNYKILIILFLLIFGCETNNINKKVENDIITGEVFSNKGFTLVFKESLKKQKIVTKKIDSRSLIVFQKNLKKNTKVKITNLINNKSILATVGSNSKYPNFYNSVVSNRIFIELELNEKEPYVEIASISQNSTFVAKEAKMYEEEKEVANKVPVEGVSISDLSLNKKKVKENQKKISLVILLKLLIFIMKIPLN